jgi:hypothetical protein
MIVVLALAAIPLVVLRGRTLVQCYATQLAVVAILRLASLRLPIAPAAYAMLVLAVFAVFLATGTHVRWSAGRAALVAAIVYLLTIPAMTRVPIDGDEPFYLLVTESLVHDRDLDLANQYRTLDRTASGRTDLKPQYGDPTGPNGEQYSRHEPFLALLMIPGYLIAGLHGAVATIALFGVLLVRSTIRLLEDEGIDEATQRAVFPFFALAPPVLFYAARIWPEVPAAFFFVEALRGMRNRRVKRWLPALLGLVLLKLRFVLIAVALLPFALRARRPLLIALIAAPLLIVWAISGNPLNVHSWEELLPAHPSNYARGFFGLLLDGAAGIAFQAPFYLLALAALVRWRDTPHGFRLGILASLLYLLYLVPRDEWHGGWSPPLRYIVFLMPVLALGAASVWQRMKPLAPAFAIWTIGLVLHGLMFPWRLFHIASGENAAGEFLSSLYLADFSRMFPSYIRVNDAAYVAPAILAALLFLRSIPLLALGLAFAFVVGKQPGETIHFEDSHVEKRGGELYPEQYAMMRFAYRGGWILHAGQSVTFQVKQGRHTLHYLTGIGATIEMEGHTYTLPSVQKHATFDLQLTRTGRATLNVVSGSVNLERLERE